MGGRARLHPDPAGRIMMDTVQTLRPQQVKKLQMYISRLARMMLPATFLEDAYRLLFDFYHQYKFLASGPRALPWLVAGFILVASILIQLVGSGAIMARV